MSANFIREIGDEKRKSKLLIVALINKGGNWIFTRIFALKFHDEVDTIVSNATIHPTPINCPWPKCKNRKSV